MILPYTAFPSPIKGLLIYRPIIQLKIYVGAKSYKTWGMLDSGCDRTLINKQIGKQFDVDFKACKVARTSGVSGQPVPTLESEINMEILGLTGKIQNVQISYISSDNVGILLGHVGFFEFFKINFDTAQKQFEIIPNSQIPPP
jgi:hypothetical protein